MLRQDAKARVALPLFALLVLAVAPWVSAGDLATEVVPGEASTTSQEGVSQQCADSSTVVAPLSLAAGGGGNQCAELTGCGYTARVPSDLWCNAKCQGACEPYTFYEAGYYDEATNCCICVAV